MKKSVFFCALGLAAMCMTLFILSCSKDKNSPPAIMGVTLFPSSVHANGMVLVSVLASDPDWDKVTYSYTVSGGTAENDISAAYWTVPSTPGTYTVTVTCTDSKGASSTREATLNVLEPVTQISGIAEFAKGTSGSHDLADSKVNVQNFTTGSFVASTTLVGLGFRAVFNVPDVPAGSYKLSVWKDNDKDGTGSIGDYMGWYGTGPLMGPEFHQIPLPAGGTFTCRITMYVGI